MNASEFARAASTLVIKCLTFLAVVAAYNVMFGALVGFLSAFIVFTLGILAADSVGDWWNAKGYDMAVGATASVVSSFGRFRAAVSARVAK